MSQIPVYLTMGLGSMVAAVGCASFVDPAKGWETFGMPSTSKESEVLAYIFGARAMMIGSTFVWLGFKGQRRIMAQLTVPWCIMVLLDCWVVYNYGLKGKVNGHAIGLCLTAGLGYWLSRA